MLNWKVRYAKIIAKYRELLDPSISLLEVGCGAYGIATFLDRPVVGVEPDGVQPMVENLTIQRASVSDLPFENDAFDVVVCVDVLEHLAAPDRIPAIREMLRVAKRRLILSCPTRYYGELGEHELASWFQRRYGDIPGWLQEHLTNGLPDTGELIQAVASLGFPFEVFGNEGMLQHVASILLDWEFSLTQALLSHHNNKTMLEAPIQSSDWDLFYSHAVSIMKDECTAPSVKPRTEIQGPIAAPTIYAACHHRSLLPCCGAVTPIFTGPAAIEASNHELTDILSTQERLDNSRWSELSGIYKIWKEGPRHSVIGFCHYRRFFDFSGANDSVDCSAIRKGETAHYQSHFYSEDRLARCLEKSVILPHPVRLDQSPFQHYSEFHQANDLCLMISLVAQQAPQLLPYLDNLLSGQSFYACNMFAMKWQLFDDLCETWFLILRQFEMMVPAGRASRYQNRDISFLAERLFDVWIRYAVDKYSLEIDEVPIYFVAP